jgi:porin
MNKRKTFPGKFALITTSLLLAFHLPAAMASEDETPDFAAETLTGDWGGMRSAAAKNGFVWEGAVKVDTLRNRGAQRNGTRSVGHVDLKLTMDLEKAAGWSGTTAMLNVINDSGKGLAPNFINNQMGVTNIEVGAPTTTRLFQAWIQKSLFDDRLAILAGLYPVDSEFFTMESAGVFLGPQYGTPADLAQTKSGTGPSIFNNSGFGIRARWNIAPTVYAMGAVLDGVPNDPRFPKRTSVRFKKGEGSMSIAELGWLPEADNEGFKGHAKAALGFWGYSAKVADQLDATQMRRSQGGYVLGERTLLNLAGEADRYLSGFARYTWTDGDSTAVENSLNLGLHLKGPVASRPDDIIGLAWTKADLSGKWRSAQTDPTHRAEQVTELTYRYAVTPFVALQPNLQFVKHPGGMVGTPNARLIGFRLDLAL